MNQLKTLRFPLPNMHCQPAHAHAEHSFSTCSNAQHKRTRKAAAWSTLLGVTQTTGTSTNRKHAYQLMPKLKARSTSAAVLAAAVSKTVVGTRRAGACRHGRQHAYQLGVMPKVQSTSAALTAPPPISEVASTHLITLPQAQPATGQPVSDQPLSEPAHLAMSTPGSAGR